VIIAGEDSKKIGAKTKTKKNKTKTKWDSKKIVAALCH
jgi:hypothetical protein